MIQYEAVFPWAAVIPMAMGIAGMVSSGVTNARNRKAAKKQREADIQRENEMYKQQRDHALQDAANANKYNAPENQMNLLRQAGLNPSLVYGKGAENTAALIRSSDFGKQQREPDKYSDIINPGLGTVMESGQNFLNMRKVQAETDNLYTNNINQEKQGLLLDANLSKTLTETAKSKFQLSQSQRIADIVFKRALLENEKKSADIEFTLGANRRGALQTYSNIEKQLQDILESKSRVEKNSAEKAKIEEATRLLGNQRTMQQIENELARNGVFKNDPYYIRYALKALLNMP